MISLVIHQRRFKVIRTSGMLMETRSIIRLYRVTLATMGCRAIRILSSTQLKLVPLCFRRDLRSIPLNTTSTNHTAEKETIQWVVKWAQTPFCTQPCKLQTCTALNWLPQLQPKDKSNPPRDPNSYKHHPARVAFHLTTTWLHLSTWKRR